MADLDCRGEIRMTDWDNSSKSNNILIQCHRHQILKQTSPMTPAFCLTSQMKAPMTDLTSAAGGGDWNGEGATADTWGDAGATGEAGADGYGNGFDSGAAAHDDDDAGNGFAPTNGDATGGDFTCRR